MKRLVSLSYLTVTGIAPPEHVSVAADAGFDAVGLRLVPPLEGEEPWPMGIGSPMLAETMSRLRDRGVSVLDIEMIKLERFPDARVHRPAFEAAAALGARNILCTSNDPNESVTIERVGRLAELANEFDLHVHFEFMPWARGALTLDQAERIVRAAGSSNLHIMVDAIHLFRTGGQISDLKKLPASRFLYVQMCDAPAEAPRTAEGIVEQGRFERLFPGEGGLDLNGLVRALPQGIPISIEAPKRSVWQTQGYAALARQAHAATALWLRDLERGEAGYRQHVTR